MELIKLFGDEVAYVEPLFRSRGRWVRITDPDDCITCEQCNADLFNGDEYYSTDDGCFCGPDCADNY